MGAERGAGAGRPADKCIRSRTWDVGEWLRVVAAKTSSTDTGGLSGRDANRGTWYQTNKPKDVAIIATKVKPKLNRSRCLHWMRTGSSLPVFLKDRKPVYSMPSAAIPTSPSPISAVHAALNPSLPDRQYVVDSIQVPRRTRPSHSSRVHPSPERTQ